MKREQSWAISEEGRHLRILHHFSWEMLPTAKIRTSQILCDIIGPSAFIYHSLLFIDGILIIKEAFRRSANEFYWGSDTCAIANYNEQINLLFPSLAEYPTYFSHWDHSPVLDSDNKESSENLSSFCPLLPWTGHGLYRNFIYCSQEFNFASFWILNMMFGLGLFMKKRFYYVLKVLI